MNNEVAGFIIFAAGAAIGSIVTWKLVKTKYERIAKEEIDSVKEVFSKKKDTTPKTFEPKKFEPEKFEPKKFEPEKEEPEQPKTYDYTEVLSKYGYRKDEEDEEKGEQMKEGPYVISPDEFGENGYTLESFTYYADDVLTDEFDEIIYDLENTVGEDFASHFGEYEEDSVFIRNDELETDFEILRDLRNYSDVVQGPSHQDK